MMKRARLTTVSIAISLHAASLAAQQVGGQVLAEHGAPARGAFVQLLDSALVAVDSTTSDSSGTFYLSASRAGTYALRVTLSGLLPVETRPFRLTADAFHQERITVSARPSTHVYFEFQVEEQVTPLAGNRAPQYPASQRMNHTEGEVLLQFVVDSTGRPLVSTAKVLRSTHEDFTHAVLLVLPSFRFKAARIAGHPVAQLVQMPFQFNLTP